MAPTKRTTKKKRAAPSIGRKLSAFERQIKDRERDISRIRTGAMRRTRAQRDSDEEIRRLSEERDILRGTLEAVAGHQKATADERTAAVTDLKAAKAEWAAIQKRVRKHPAFRKATKAAATVDDRIDGVRERVAALEAKAGAAESRASGARARLAAAEKTRREAQEAIQKRAHEIRAARAELARVIADAKAANSDDVHTFAASERRFQAAVEGLRASLRGNEANLADSLLDTAPVDKARGRVEDETRTINKIRTDLADAQVTLQSLVQGRDNAIRSKILKPRPDNG